MCRRHCSSAESSPAPLASEPGPASLAARAGDDSPQEGWARRSAPTYLNLRKASIYGGSNEIQRQIISRTILGL